MSSLPNWSHKSEQAPTSIRQPGFMFMSAEDLPQQRVKAPHLLRVLPIANTATSKFQLILKSCVQTAFTPSQKMRTNKLSEFCLSAELYDQIHLLSRN